MLSVAPDTVNSVLLLVGVTVRLPAPALAVLRTVICAVAVPVATGTVPTTRPGHVVEAGFVTEATGGGCVHVLLPGGFTVMLNGSDGHSVVTFVKTTSTSRGPSCVPAAPVLVVQAIVGKAKPLDGTTTENVCVPV